MRNKKCILVFTLIIAFLLLTITCVQATDDNPLTIINTQEPTTSNNQENNTVTNNQQNNTVNNTQAPIISTNTTNNTANNTATNTLPQTGVAEDTALFVFIAICIVSAVYAFVRIRNYKNI